MNKFRLPSKSVLIASLIGLSAAMLAANSRAAQADISSTPLASTTSAQVKPNIMLLMDTSGSMGWTHMPDELEVTAGIAGVGYKSAQCNTLYYNPNTKYLVPKKPNGDLLPTPTFTAAPYAGYLAYYAVPENAVTGRVEADTTDNAITNLSTSFRAYDRRTLRTDTASDTAKAAYYYVYSGSQTLKYDSAACADLDTGVTRGATGGGTWTRVLVSTTSGTGPVGADETGNFAIWYSYYRTRISMTKSAVSLAFTPLTDSNRVGFITMQPKDSPSSPTINAAKYVAIDDFNSTQRSTWYSKLFSQIPGGASPAREGLARVGRHYGGKQDGINAGMTGSPVQYSCQQNFTIMTTDGYWNSQTESTNVTGGPVALDGTRLDLVTLAGYNQPTNWDGKLTADSGNSPRPIWDGFADASNVVVDSRNNYSYADCGSFAYLSTSQALASTTQALQSTNQITQSKVQTLQSTLQALKNTAQNLQSTTQVTQSTSQNLQSTTQRLASTNQNLQSTTEITQSTAQVLASTNQNRQSTVQNLQSTTQNIAIATQVTQTLTVMKQSTSQIQKSTSQLTQSTTQPKQTTTQKLQSTVQNLKSTNQNLQSTTQTTQSTTQPLQSTVQNLKTTTQNLQSTTQTTQSTSQPTKSTLQVTQSTSQVTITTAQVSQSTVQLKSCDASTELCTFVPSCTPGGLISCQTFTTGPSLVASCTPSTGTSANSYLTTTCATTTTGPTGAASCTASGATSFNNYTTTTCSSATTGPTAVASCAPITANAGNSWTATTCNNVTTGPTPIASCTPVTAASGNSWTATTCGSVVTGPTGVASCTAASPTSGNNYTTTTCGTNNTSNVAVASCAASDPTSGNSYTRTTCSTNNTSNVAVSSCAASGPTSGNSYTTTTCSTNNTSAVPVSSCTPSGGTSGNNWVSTTCTSNNTGPTGVSTCSSISASAGNSWTTTTCGSNNTSNVPVASCTAALPTAGNSYTTVTCPAAVVTTSVPSSTCTPATASSGNSWTTTTCGTNNTTNVPVGSCTASSATSGNNWTTTTCPAAIVVGPTAVQTCTIVAASSGNSWTSTACSSTNTGPTGVSTCTPITGTAGNSWVTTTCNTATTTSVPSASCTPATAASGNSWTTTTCFTATTGPTAVATCTAAAASSGNSFTATTCAPTVTGPTVVASCTPSAATSGNGYTATTCGTIVVNTPIATCVASGPTAGNNYTTTTCGTNNTTNVAVQTCTPSGPTAGNNYTTTTCSTNNTTNVAVATCTASAATAGNAWTTTTCPAPVVTGPTAVASCTVTAASSGNSFTSTTCTNNNTGPTGVASCTPITAASGNNWTATTCGTNNTTNIPVLSCTPSTATSGNAWTTTTCPAPNVTTNLPVSTCTIAAATSGNSWTSTTCSDNNTTNVPVSSCTASAKTSGNNWTTTTCPAPVTTGPVGVASCTPVVASLGTNWVATTCGNPVTTNVPVQTCTAASPVAGNGYTTTTCSTNNTTNVPVASCAPVTATSGNGWTTTVCPTPVATGPTPVATCTPAAASSGNAWTATTCSSNNSGSIAVASCTPDVASAANSWTGTTCGTNPTSNVPVQTCTPSGPSAGNAYTTTTCSSATTTNVPVGACTPTAAGAGNAWVTTTCNTATTGPTLSPSCTPEAASAGNSWTATICVPAPGKKLQYTTTTTTTTTPFSGGIQAGAPVVVSSTSTPLDVNGFCYIPGAEPQPVQASGPSGGSNPGPNPSTIAGCTAWPCTTSTNNPAGGSINSLADVAQYYYVTDLRPSTVADTGKLKPSQLGAEDDRATWVHMTTFTIALGVSGTLQYTPDYRTATTGDFAAIRAGSKSWPLWPDPALPIPPTSGGTYDNWNNPRSIDDFWHTAVNGRGQYFSADSPTSVVSGLSSALAGIDARLSAGAAAGTSTLQPVAGDNFIFIGSYITGDWSGDVKASEIDVATGDVTATVNWSADQLLGQKVKDACDTRNIYLMRGSSALTNFTWGTRTCDSGGSPTGTANTGLNAAEQANFALANLQLLSHYPEMTDGSSGSVDQRSLAVGSNLVNFLRGQRGMEGFEAGNAGKLYRSRLDKAGAHHVLGDIVGGQPVYVKAPSSGYQDADYVAFQASAASRAPMVYVAANDGMLHAFYAGTSGTDTMRGQEAWAVIPSTVLPNMWKLADKNYGKLHQFYVDGTPVVGDVHDSSATGAASWKTLLVGGLNAGGKGYYALDVTDPTTPRPMWEFKFNSASCSTSGATSDCNLGLTFGKPVITKIIDSSYPEGRWVVMVSSGYNNVNGVADDGHGFLYVLDAITGTVVYKIDTGAGDATTPSNLGQLTAYVDDGTVNNTALRVYGTDMMGNIWRFDVNDTQAPNGREAALIGQAKDAAGVAQPITTRAELAELGGKPMVFVGTGRLLGATDNASSQQQSLYGIVDPLTSGSPVYADLRGSLKPLQLSAVVDATTLTRTVACTSTVAADCARTAGWVVDLSETGERVNVDMKLVSGTLVAASNVPSDNPCTPGGHGWFNFLDYASGNAVTSAGGLVSERFDLGQIVGFGVYRLANGDFYGQIRGGGGGNGTSGTPPCLDCKKEKIYVDPLPPKGKRISWREIAQ